MLRHSYNKNTVSASNSPPVGRGLLRAKGSIILRLAAEIHPLLAAGTGSRIPNAHTQQIPPPKPVDSSPPLEVFTAYTHYDERYFKKIKEQLNILQRQRWPISCHESEIIYSTEWQRSGHLATANLILLLVSNSFLDTDFCYCDL